jgi:repressor LexA
MIQDTSTLSSRQQEMLKMIRAFSAHYGYPPTIRQIGDTVGISSTSVVSYNLAILQRKGYLARDRDVSRGLRLVEEEATETLEYMEMESPVHPLALPSLQIPLLGHIAAGEPLPLPDSDPASAATDYIALTSDIVKDSKDLYALKVRGNSMIDALINDGDIVVLRHQRVAEEGEMIAAWLVEEKATTLKRFYWEKNHTLVRLQPATPAVPPIYVHPSNLEIHGKVVAVIRRMD